MSAFEAAKKEAKRMSTREEASEFYEGLYGSEAQESADTFGIAEVFATHLEISLANMHPAQAFEAAQHATRAYLSSYDFISTNSYKGASGPPSYQMVAKRPQRGGEAMR